ncbi:hypothetical protein [Paenibacillus woosongensis]|uniref:hypothetical protein n=1 Tax=Paenibacillus woosongensis TaxID=307580 RepID=UPI0018C245DF|nr:hypothetical protein [Paenibacillus woosongensis]
MTGSIENMGLARLPSRHNPASGFRLRWRAQIPEGTLDGGIQHNDCYDEADEDKYPFLPLVHNKRCASPLIRFVYL